MSTPMAIMRLCFQTAGQNCTILAWIWGKEHDIIVDNKSATGKIRIYFFSQTTNMGSKKAIWAILAANLMWAVEPVLAKVERKLSG